MTTDRNFRILIVDDEPDILEFLSYNLEKDGFTVFVSIWFTPILGINELSKKIITPKIIMKKIYILRIC